MYIIRFMYVFIASIPKALLLLYDITSKSSFDNIRVSVGFVYNLEIMTK